MTPWGVHPLRAIEDMNVDDLATGPAGEPERAILHVLGLIAKDGLQKALFRRQFGLAFRRDFSDEDIPFVHGGTDPNDAVGTEVFELRLTDVRDVASDDLGSEFGVADIRDVGLNVDGIIIPFLHDAIGNNDRVFEVVTFPRHVRDEQVLAQRQLSPVRRRNRRPGSGLCAPYSRAQRTDAC